MPNGQNNKKVDQKFQINKDSGNTLASFLVLRLEIGEIIDKSFNRNLSRGFTISCSRSEEKCIVLVGYYL
jgi:hypothetical protein